MSIMYSLNIGKTFVGSIDCYQCIIYLLCPLSLNELFLVEKRKGKKNAQPVENDGYRKLIIVIL